MNSDQQTVSGEVPGDDLEPPTSHLAPRTSHILRNAWLDIAVTVLIVTAVIFGGEVARWGVVVYTPIMLLLKIAAFKGRHSPARLRPQDAGVPVVVYHFIYAANVGLLVYGALFVSTGWWWVAVCWALIWLLSAAAGKGKARAKSEVGEPAPSGARGRTSEVGSQQSEVE